jgi:hypothetical protein
MAQVAVAAVIAAGSAAYQHRQAEKRHDRVMAAQQELQDTELAIQSEQAARGRREAIARSLRARAQIEAQSQAQGAAASSAAITASQDVTSQAAGNIQDIGRQVTHSGMITAARQNISRASQPTMSEAIISGISGAVAQQAAGTVGEGIGTSVASLFE